MAAGWIVTYICCWAKLLEGKACCFYNCIFSPFVLCFHSSRIYFCACISQYMHRGFLKFCCLLCRVCNCCWLYSDKKFPPNEKSLGQIGGDSANVESGKNDTDVIWLRAGKFTHSGKMQLFGETVDSRDICQGALGDCWLLAAMACLADHKGAIQSLFRSKERDPRGKYTVRLYDGVKERWETMTIDDYIPCDAKAYNRDGTIKPMFSQPNGSELWAMLLEKAFAKFCRSYANLEGGSTVWALRAMTGDLARSFYLDKATGMWQRKDIVNVDDADDRRKHHLRPREEKIDGDTMFQILKKYDYLQSVLSASGASGVDGLHSGHAYSILQVKVAKDVRLLQIRNPWGSGEWKGAWSDQSDMWEIHPDVKRAVGFENVDDGAFWMCWEDFCANWSSVGIVDRTVDINTLKLEVSDDTACAPCMGCCGGCCDFWCCCTGPKRLYFPHHSSDETVSVKRRCCAIL